MSVRVLVVVDGCHAFEADTSRCPLSDADVYRLALETLVMNLHATLIELAIDEPVGKIRRRLVG